MKSLLKLLGSTSFSQLLVVLISPILSRVYSPNAFGEFLLLTSWLYIINSIAQGRMDVAILTAKDEEEIKNTFSIGFYVVMFVTLLTACILLLIDFIKHLPIYYYLIPLMIFSLSFYQLIVALYLRKNNIGFVAGNKIRQSLTLSGGQLVLGFISPSVFSLAVAQIISFITTCLFSFKNWKSYLNYVNPIHFFNKYKNFLVFDSLSNLLQMLAKHLPPILIASLLGGFMGGIYYMAFRVLMMPVAVFSVSINQMVSSQYNKFLDRKAEWQRKNSVAILIMILLFFIPFSLLSAYVEIIFPILFGSEWALTGELIKYFSAWIFLRLIYGSFIINLSLSGKSKIKMKLDALIFIVNIASIYGLWYLGFGGVDLLKIYALINVVVLLVSFVVLNLKSHFKTLLNVSAMFFSLLFIMFYWRVENFAFSVFLLVFYLGMILFFYKNKRRYF